MYYFSCDLKWTDYKQILPFSQMYEWSSVHGVGFKLRAFGDTSKAAQFSEVAVWELKAHNFDNFNKWHIYIDDIWICFLSVSVQEIVNLHCLLYHSIFTIIVNLFNADIYDKNMSFT